MSQYGWIPLISLCGWLVLATASYRAYRVGARTTLVMALAWLAIFALAFAIFTAIGA